MGGVYRCTPLSNKQNKTNKNEKHSQNNKRNYIRSSTDWRIIHNILIELVMIIERIKFYKTNEVKKEIHDSGYTKYYKSGRIKVEYFSNARVRTDHNGNEHISYL